jgi:hypothetical protein
MMSVRYVCVYANMYNSLVLKKERGIVDNVLYTGKKHWTQ